MAMYIKSREPARKGTHARRLAARLRQRGVKTKVVGNTCHNDRRVYNMGNGRAIDDPTVPTLNRVDAVRLSVDKRQFIKCLHTAGIPVVLSNITDNLGDPTEKRPWYVRTITKGHSGAGIELVTSRDQLKPEWERCLITQPSHSVTDQRTCKELRIHLFKGDVFHIQQKRRMTGDRVEDADLPETRIRNCVRTYGNGWVFANTFDPIISDDMINKVKAVAADVMRVVGIDLGCVDISINTKSGNIMVIETGTSPALAGDTTMRKYVSILEGWCNAPD